MYKCEASLLTQAANQLTEAWSLSIFFRYWKLTWTCWLETSLLMRSWNQITIHQRDRLSAFLGNLVEALMFCYSMKTFVLSLWLRKLSIQVHVISFLFVFTPMIRRQTRISMLLKVLENCIIIQFQSSLIEWWPDSNTSL